MVFQLNEAKNLTTLQGYGTFKSFMAVTNKLFYGKVCHVSREHINHTWLSGRLYTI